MDIAGNATISGFREQIVVVEARLRLRINIETVIAIPVHGALQAPWACIDAAVTEGRCNVAVGGTVAAGNTKIQRTVIVLIELAVATELIAQLIDVLA